MDATNGHRLLALAILTRAGLDLQSRNSAKRAEARRWLVSDPLARYLCDELDIRDDVLRTVVASTRARR